MIDSCHSNLSKHPAIAHHCVEQSTRDARRFFRTLHAKITKLTCIASIALLTAACAAGSGQSDIEGEADDDRLFGEIQLNTAYKRADAKDDANKDGASKDDTENAADANKVDFLGDFEKKSSTRAFGGGIGVNAYLWRATLDTLDFLPLKSADPFGGVIITDWYNARGSPNERLKVVIYILDTRLRADAIRVRVFRERRRNAVWQTVQTSKLTAQTLESTILSRARERRVTDELLSKR